MQFSRTLTFMTAALLLVGCKVAAPDSDTNPADDDPQPSATGTGGEVSAPEPEGTEPVSILRPEIEQPKAPDEAKALEAYKGVIGFPEGGTKLDPDALAALQDVLDAPQLPKGLPITLRAHSDAAGSDAANLKASEARGQAVADWLIENGVDPDRITIVAFGEQNPVAPNALPDGTPNPAGRAANRRVEVEIAAMVLSVSTTETGDAKASVEARD